MTETRVPARHSPRGQRGAEASARSPDSTDTSSRNSINAGLGGVGGGTGIVAIAQQVGAHTVIGQVLLYIAPSVSVIAGAVIYQLKLRAGWYNEKSQVKKARNTLQKQLKSSHVTEDYKNEVRQMLEELNRTEATAELDRIKSLWNHLTRSG